MSKAPKLGNVPKLTMTEGFDPDVVWEPYIDGPMVGYKITSKIGGRVTRIYMNPSTSGEGEPDVFVYSGRTGDPARDTPLNYFCPEF